MRGVIYFTLFSCFISWAVAANAQEADSIPQPHFKTFNEYFFLGPVLKKRDLNFTMSSKKDPNGSISFKPNASYSIGVNTYIFDLGIEASLSIPIGEKNIERYGNSDIRDLQVSAISKRFLADAYWQKYSGFYYSYPSLKVHDNQPYPQRADITARNFGTSFAYVFNHGKFSIRSAYTFLDQQLRSKGSPVLSFVVSSFDLKGDSALVSKSLRPTNPDADVDEARFTSFGIAPGYSYNLVVRKFFLNLTLIAGPAHYWIRYHLENEETHNDIEINLYTNARIAVGYNGNRFFSGISYSSQGRNLTFEQIEFSNSINTFRLVLGYRFRESGILKRSVMDYIPSFIKRN
ncbi:MAG TPA: DUF4421 family protein [Cyclobacteriaceae bacterium]